MVVGVEEPVVGGVPPLWKGEREGKSQDNRRTEGDETYPIIEVTDGS